MSPTLDPFFKVVTLAATPEPQKLVWLSAHQDYSSEPVYGVKGLQSETKYGDAAINALLKGGKGHFGCLEHPQITLNCCYFPHSTVMQARTHRIGVSFDVQSFRYTSQSILLINSLADLDKAFYFRAVGDYVDRQGHKYTYTEDDLQHDKQLTCASVGNFKQKIRNGHSEEHARECLTTNYRQHFVFSANLRSLFHFLDLRSKADAQLEIQSLSDLLLAEALNWCPELTQWYIDNRWKKAKLSP